MAIEHLLPVPITWDDQVVKRIDPAARWCIHGASIQAPHLREVSEREPAVFQVVQELARVGGVTDLAADLLYREPPPDRSPTPGL